MNFIVVLTKLMAKDERNDKDPVTGKKKTHQWFVSAYTIDRVKAKMMRLLSLGRLKIIEEEAQCAVDQIINKLGTKGFIKNLTIDYHVNSSGNDNYSSVGSEMRRLGNGYAGEETTVYTWQCWAGGCLL